MITLKLGPKGRHLGIPAGWLLVTTGVAQEWDKFANVGSKTPFWQLTESDDWGMTADTFDALIRPCKHERLNMDGQCFSCGMDCRGFY